MSTRANNTSLTPCHKYTPCQQSADLFSTRQPFAKTITSNPIKIIFIDSLSTHVKPLPTPLQQSHTKMSTPCQHNFSSDTLTTPLKFNLIKLDPLPSLVNFNLRLMKTLSWQLLRPLINFNLINLDPLQQQRTPPTHLCRSYSNEDNSNTKPPTHHGRLTARTQHSSDTPMNHDWVTTPRPSVSANNCVASPKQIRQLRTIEDACRSSAASPYSFSTAEATARQLNGHTSLIFFNN